jgi:uncharacterized protein (TIGR02246 family)
MNRRPLRRTPAVRAALALLILAGCSSGRSHADTSMNLDLQDFATRYTAAWCSQDPARVASFFAEDGSLTINDGAPSVGRAAITEAARGFMTAFPDMVVAMDSLYVEEDVIEYHWTLTGTNTGPGGTGNAVRISGYEAWTLGADGLIAASKGHFDEAEYRRQLEHGFDGT